MTTKEKWELIAYAMLDQSCYEQQRSYDLYQQADANTQTLYNKFRQLFLRSLKNDKSTTSQQ